MTGCALCIPKKAGPILMKYFVWLSSFGDDLDSQCTLIGSTRGCAQTDFKIYNGQFCYKWFLVVLIIIIK